MRYGCRQPKESFMEAGLGVGGIQQDCAGIEQPENGSKFPKYGKKNLTLHTTMWDLPRPGVEPVSPTLAGRFLSTGPPGSPHPALCATTMLCIWRRKWQYIPVFLPGKSHGWRTLVGYSPWGRKESDTTELLHFLSFCLSFTLFIILCFPVMLH